MNLIPEFLPESLTAALGWSLLHSLWQAALAGIILALLLILLNRHSAKVRYTVSLLSMAAVLVMFVATFTRLYTAEASPEAASVAHASHSVSIYDVSGSETQLPLWDRLIESGKVYYAAHVPLLVSLWLLGLLVMSLRFMGGLAYVQRLRHYKTQPLGQHWQDTLEQLKQSMGVRQSVRLVESALVQVPMAIGYFKPVILFPIGAVTGLSQRQVEAVLAHELAHITRHDYLLNMLQQVVETVFFFHPAVWWMSGMVRTEREHCCDDLAVEVCGDNVTYARALAQLESLRMPAGGTYALALTGSKGSLLSRVKRLVSNADLRPSFREGFMAALVIVGGFMLLSFGAWAGMRQEDAPELAYTLPTETEEAAPVEPEEETNMATTLTLQDGNGQTSDVVIIKNKKGEVTELYVNGKRIPKKDIPEFQQLIDQRLQATNKAPRMKSEERARTLREAEERLANTPRNGNSYNYSYTYSGNDSMHLAVPPIPPVPPTPPSPGAAPLLSIPPMPPIPPIPPLDFGATSKENKKSQERYKQDMNAYEQEVSRYKVEAEQYAKEIENLAHQQAQASASRSHELSARRQEASLKIHEANMKRHDENMRRHEENMKRHEERSEILENVHKEMIKDGLIKEGDKVYDFKINNEGLYIGGKKQSEALHKKYRNLMKTKDGKTFDFTYKRDKDNVHIQSSER